MKLDSMLSAPVLNYTELLVLDKIYYSELKKNNCLAITDYLPRLVNKITLFLVGFFKSIDLIQIEMNQRFELGIKLLERNSDSSLLLKNELREIRRILSWGGPLKNVDRIEKTEKGWSVSATYLSIVPK